MINFIKEQLAIRKLKRNLREYNRPDRVFLKSARLRFITMAQQNSSVNFRARHLPSFRYATIALMGVLAMTSGMAVFADVNDVPVTHSLYQFKRLSENVRLEVSSPEKKVALHQVIIQRRVKELKELNKPDISQATKLIDTTKVIESSTEINLKETVLPKKVEISKQKRIKKLDSDFEKQAKDALDEIQKFPTNKEGRINICKEITEAVNGGPASSSRHFIEQVKTRCDKVLFKTDED